LVLDHEQEASVTVAGDRLNSGQDTYDPPRGETITLLLKSFPVGPN
jgi:hypothetical protein